MTSEIDSIFFKCHVTLMTINHFTNYALAKLVILNIMHSENSGVKQFSQVCFLGLFNPGFTVTHPIKQP